MSRVYGYCRHNIIISLGNNYLFIELNVYIIINLNPHNKKHAARIRSFASKFLIHKNA